MGDEYKSHESFYNGGASNFNDSYGQFMGGKHYAATNLGFPGSTQTANQLGEAVKAIKQGVKAFEVTMGNADTAEQIPKQNFEEMRALMKISGVSPSVHAPFTIDASGFAQQKGFSEENRAEAERRLYNVLQRASELSKEKNVNVVFHSSGGVPGSEYRPGDESKGEKRFHAVKSALINKETGELSGVKEDKLFFPDHPEELKEGHVFGVDARIRSYNENHWDQTITGLNTYKNQADELIQRFIKEPAVLEFQGMGELTPEKVNQVIKEKPEFGPSLGKADVMSGRVDNFLDNSRLNFNNAFHTAYKYGTEEQKEQLKELSEDWKKKLQGVYGNPNKFDRNIQLSQLLDQSISGLISITGQQVDTEHKKIVSGAPKLFVPAEEFAREKAAETFGNLAWRGYKELGGEKAPVVAIENMMPGEWAHSTGEGMEALIKASRKKFIENATGKGMDKNDAEKAAEKLIGATWDVGHLNIMKKHGFEDKDVIEATKKIAPYVKHVHLTDNFGYSDSHLAPGMGNVPIRQILEELEKKGNVEEMTKIVEGVGFVQHFQRSPHGLAMAALGSPIYGAKMGPYWNQVIGIPSGGGYMGGPMTYLPEKHFSMYGSGFSSLPSELGGQMGGGASRISGTPNA